jgi:hypothetical protein
MSLLSCSGGTLYLGELFNLVTPLAHANFVNYEYTLVVFKYLNDHLPGLKVARHKCTYLALHHNLGRRIAQSPQGTRQCIEEFAVLHGFHTLLYKLFDSFTVPYIEWIKRY